MIASAPAHSPMTVAEYLAFSDAHPRTRFNLLAGVAVATAPASIRHEMICANIDRALAGQVAALGCRSHRDVGVARGLDADFMPEPDIMVRCGPLDDARRWVDDPVAVIEVLWPSTMLDDRGYKLREYLSFPTLRHIALVYQDERRVEHWTRGASGDWSETPQVLQRPGDRLSLSAVDATLALSAIYDGVSFD